MNDLKTKKSLALIFSLLALVILAVLGASFFTRTINDTKLTSRYLTSLRAFWAAEAGIDQARQKIADCVDNGNCSASGNITYSSNEVYQYTANTSLINGLYYRIDSSGSGKGLTRSISSVIEDVTTGGFIYSLETIGNVDIQTPAAKVDPPINENSTNWTDDPDYFETLFGMSKESLKANADCSYTNPPNNVTPVEGVTWIELSDGNQVVISANTWEGNGILIVQGGDVILTGGTFNGILYVEGTLEVSAGNPTINGTILVEDTPSDTTKIAGVLDLNYDPDAIKNALRSLGCQTVSWQEN